MHSLFARLWFAVLVVLLIAAVSPAQSANPVEASPSIPPNLPPADGVLKRLVVDDFNRPGLQNNLGGDANTWNMDPTDPQSQCTYRLDKKTRRGAAGNSLRLDYHLNLGKSSQNGFWLKLQGVDASDYDHLELWIKGDPDPGFAASLKIEVSQPKPGSPGQSLKGSYVVQGITNEWRRFLIPLNMLSGIESWTNLDTLVLGFHSRREKIRHGAVFLDDLAFVKTGEPGPSVRDEVATPKKLAWEAARGGKLASEPYVILRLAGWPSRLLADTSSFPQDDREFLQRIARDTWSGIDSLCDREHRLPCDQVTFGTNSVDPLESRAGDYLNVTDIGIYLMSVTAACDLGYLSREEALDRLRTTLNSIEAMESYDGFLYNYYDTTTLERTSNFISFVDSAWLTSGLMVVRQAFAELNERCSKLIDRTDYRFFYDDVEQVMNHGFYVNMPCRAEYTYGLLYTESRAGSLIAIGKGDVPAVHWFELQRTFPADARWQSLQPQGRKTKMVDGYETTGGWYEWEGLKFVPSWGGSLFEALMPTVIIDEKRYGPDNVGSNDVLHAEIQRRYALESLKYPVWGMSPCFLPSTNSYGEFGVKVLGVRGYPAGVVTPHVTALALYVTPREAIANLRKLIEHYSIYGQYGFYDAVDPLSGQVVHKYLVLDQGMIFLALANYLNDQCVQKHFAADPIARKALPLLSYENFFAN